MSASLMAEEEILTTKEVAKILRCTPKTVREMIKDGQLDAFPVRSEYRVFRSSVERLMQTRVGKSRGGDSDEEQAKDLPV